MDQLQRRAKLTHGITLVCLLALMALLVFQFLLLNPGRNGLIITALHCLPLLAFLPGLLRHRPRVYIWLCFVILVYFCQGAMNSFALPARAGYLGLLEASLTTLIFCASMYAARFHSQLSRVVTTVGQGGH